jgi:hypothetical protein
MTLQSYLQPWVIFDIRWAKGVVESSERMMNVEAKRTDHRRIALTQVG